MFTIVGAIITSVCVVLGYVLHHGNLAILWQPTEILIIGGAALGSLVMANSSYTIKTIVAKVMAAFKGTGISKDAYIALVQCLYELVKMASANPISIEPHVENPEGSEIFQRYPAVLHNHHLVDFISDTLKVQIAAPLSPYDLEDLMNADIDIITEEEHGLVNAINRVSDALPGLGIVAAVLGIVITMGKLSQGKEVIGLSVAAALVGTFLGILMCYGYLQPLTAKIENNLKEEMKMINTAKMIILAYAKGVPPKICAEFGRRSVPSEYRPSFKEIDEATSNAGKK